MSAWQMSWFPQTEPRFTCYPPVAIPASVLLNSVLRHTLPYTPSESEYPTFYGMASPPTSYGGYGGNANEKPKYCK